MCDMLSKYYFNLIKLSIVLYLIMFLSKKFKHNLPPVRSRLIASTIKSRLHSSRYQLLLQHARRIDRALKKRVEQPVNFSHQCDLNIDHHSQCDSDNEIEFDHQDLAVIEPGASTLQVHDLHSNVDIIQQIHLLISYIFSECNLSQTCERKLYELIRILIYPQRELDRYCKHLNFVENICSITAYKLKYCHVHEKYISENDRLCCNSPDVADIVVFSLLDSLVDIIEKNYEYISCPVNNGSSTFTSSRTYSHLWNNIDNGLKLTLIVSIDDAAMMKSNQTCTTPVTFTIAELPYHRRVVKENIYNLAIYWGNQKLRPDILIDKVLIEPLNFLNYLQEPVVLDTSLGKIYLHIRVGIIVMDSVAKYKALNHKAFNGMFGCPYCCIKGSSTATQRGTRTFCYPFDENSDDLYKDNEFYMRNGEIADRNNSERFGIKGSTKLSKIIQIPNQVPIDYMHTILEGAFKHLLTLDPFNRRDVIKTIDQYVAHISLPHDLSRRFRSLSEIKYWKASESRTFLLHLIPILRDIVDPDSYVLIALLSTFTRYLCYSDLPRSLQIQAEQLIKIFLVAFQELYGIDKMRFNLHLLTHLSTQVTNLGCLIEASSFVFENNIFNLKRSFHGTRGQLDQMCKAYLRSKGFDKYQTRIADCFDAFHLQAQSDILGFRKRSASAEISSCFDENYQLTEEIQESLSNHHDLASSSVEFFHRFKQDHVTFHSEKYKYKRGSCSYVASYSSGNQKLFAIIKCFIKLTEYEDNYYAVITHLQELRNQKIVPDFPKLILPTLENPIIAQCYNKIFKRVRKTNLEKLIHSSCIINRCILIPIFLSSKILQNEFWINEIDTPFEHD